MGQARKIEVKGNPDREWDYFAKRMDNPLPSGRVFKTCFSVPKNYRSEDIMRSGDKVILYMSGRTPGIVEIGLLNDEPRTSEEWDRRYVIDGRQLSRKKYMVPFDSLRLDPIIPRTALLSVPVLAKAEFVRAPMVGPSYLTPAETAAIAALLNPKDLKRAGW